ncbi:MAG: DUF1501 domain-containing protein [Planctomycetes bacterium]|nr:DUF1501 domain-containing protein [Planctomycetota bacterium]
MSELGDLLARRAFLKGSLLDLGGMALGGLLAREVRPADRESAVVAPRAKHVIWLHMAGAPPQHDLFDPKPKLRELNGTPAPNELFAGQRLAFIKGHPKLLGAPHPFVRARGTDLEMCALLPRLSQVMDRVTLVRSMTTEEFNHAPAELLLFTGNARFGGASMGSWIQYGLGSLSEDLPAYVVMVSGGSDPTGGKSLWSSGFLPSELQGVQLRSRGEAVLYLENPPGVTRERRRAELDALRALNQAEHARAGDPETLARLEQYELAFRMQMTVPEATDLASEPAEVRELYGANPRESSFANHCLRARRLVERGVRFVQLFDWGWDIHGTGAHDDLLTQFPQKCRDLDRPVAALLLDLERRGLLEETLVVWGGEFGRTPMVESRDGSTFLGRDHHPGCFSIWLAGAGVKRGYVHGATDELGFRVVDGEITVRDLQATVLHLLGLDPHRLRYPYQGLEQRLIGPAEGPRIARELLG